MWEEITWSVKACFMYLLALLIIPVSAVVGLIDFAQEAYELAKKRQ